MRVVSESQNGLYFGSNIEKQSISRTNCCAPLEFGGIEQQKWRQKQRRRQVKTNASQILGCARLNTDSPIRKPALRGQYLLC
jgi:hypothetical protein